MHKESQKERHAQWRQLLEDQKTSGSSQKIFCKERGINLPQFVYYNSRFKNKADTPIQSPEYFAPVKVSVKEHITPLSEIKLSLPNGFQCILPSQLESTQIKRWVEALLSC